MRPFERWHTLWQFFIALDEEWSDEWPSEEAATDSLIQKYPADELVRAVREWHDAFDDADDAEVERIVGDFNPSYDPAETFGGYREWAEWVREHLEAELQRRKTGSTAG
jgi:hypothetical protein